MPDDEELTSAASADDDAAVDLAWQEYLERQSEQFEVMAQGGAESGSGDVRADDGQDSASRADDSRAVAAALASGDSGGVWDSGYTPVPIRLLADERYQDLNPRAVLVFAMLFNQQRFDAWRGRTRIDGLSGRVYIDCTNEWLAAHYGLTESTLKRSLRELLDWGLVDVEGESREGRRNGRRIYLPPMKGAHTTAGSHVGFKNEPNLRVKNEPMLGSKMNHTFTPQTQCGRGFATPLLKKTNSKAISKKLLSTPRRGNDESSQTQCGRGLEAHANGARTGTGSGSGMTRANARDAKRHGERANALLRADWPRTMYGVDGAELEPGEAKGLYYQFRKELAASGGDAARILRAIEYTAARAAAGKLRGRPARYMAATLKKWQGEGNDGAAALARAGRRRGGATGGATPSYYDRGEQETTWEPHWQSTKHYSDEDLAALFDEGGERSGDKHSGE